MANKKRTRKEAIQTRREIWGVALIAIGAFLGVCIYSGAIGIVGEAITSVLFGLTGMFTLAAPPVLLLGGILFIAYAGSKPQKGRTVAILLGVVFAIALMHVMVRSIISNTSLIAYIKDAYSLGNQQHKGGGVLGALLCYPLLLLTGEAGAYIFLIAGILIILLVVTRLSLREAGQRVGNQVAAGVQYASEAIQTRRKALYMEDLGHEKEEPPLSPPLTRKRKRKLSDPQPLPQRRRKGTLLEDNSDDLTFMPSAGPIRRRPQSDLLNEFDGEADIFFADGEDYIPTITYYDRQPKEDPEPFEAIPLQATPLQATPLREASLREPKSMKRQLPEPELPFHTIEPDQAEAPWGDASGDIGLAVPPAAPPAVPVPYTPPSYSLLNPARPTYGHSEEAPAETAKLIIDTLASFNVSARIVNISVGPVITRYELAPAPGVRVNRITALSDDLALALAAQRVRIEAPIPGKAAVGVEVPNKDKVTVVLRDIIDSKEFRAATSPITLALGKDIAGKVIVGDLAKMPHLLIAGATGSGKSVCINDIIISLVYKCTPEELSLILVDPKVVELSSFGTLPHLKVPVVTDPQKAAGALQAGVREMTNRYKAFAKLGARDLERYNELMPEGRLPKLVIIIDELADLMMVAPDSVEDSICRIAQLGRAAGIHLIVATQRPSADIITGLIKANIPSRIAFAVSSAIDSRIILDHSGAEKLLGRGDMLFHANGAGKPIRVQGAFVGDEEVERVVGHFQQQAMQPEFDEQLIAEMETGAMQDDARQGADPHEDELLGEAVRTLLDSGQASISMIQRRLRVGYARAARLMDIMEQRGYVGGFDGSKPRKLLITRNQYEQLFDNDDNTFVPEDPYAE